ncbi:ABC transporter substrate-binding protein [Burkholderia anthina]|uniref:ABC transporter substrate-binding protein n=1 Tax=Burkholderia anthina TaxID=179879 RepID=UPI001FC7ECE8|nr:ABC transporter substrate-binding protein [Burkholderia anthina]
MIKRRNSFHSTTMTAVAAAILSICMPAIAQDCVVKIGAVGPMTGGGSSWGLADKAGVDFEAAWTNANGGLQVGNRKCTVSVVSYDSQQTAAGGAAAANYFAGQNVHAAVGPIPSPETTGYKPVAQRYGQVNFAHSFAKDVITPKFPLAFAVSLSPHVWGATVINAAKDRFKFKSAIVVEPNDQGGVDAGTALVQEYGKAGVKASEEQYQRGTTNFAPIVARLMGMKPDAIEIGPMPPGEAGILVKQMLEAGYTGAFGRLGGGAETILSMAGGIPAQKAFYWIELAPTEDPGIRKLNADYERVMKSKAPDNTLFYPSQLAAEQLLHAISIAGTDQDGDKIASALRKMTPESRYLGKGGWRGQAQYGINQQLAFPVGMGIIANGKKEVQRRIDVASEPSKP